MRPARLALAAGLLLACDPPVPEASAVDAGEHRGRGAPAPREATAAQTGGSGAPAGAMENAEMEGASAGHRSANPKQALTRGYTARACGFDMDDDGVVGGPGDCRVCDGRTEDPDGDGVLEDLLYVDCDAGADSRRCGSPDDPCKTLEHVFERRVDGPGDGAEDIVCFSGACSPDALRIPVGGLAGVKAVPRSGNEQRDWELPSDPLMIVGWDRDGDGIYPPLDAEDRAVLDGRGLARAFDLRGGASPRLEMAHFSAAGYGQVGESGGFVHTGGPHLYVHDLTLKDISREMPTHSDRIVFGFWGAYDSPFAWVKNVRCDHCGGYFVRGNGGDGPREAGPLRFQNIELLHHPCSYGSSPECDHRPYATALKLWGYVQGIEFIDSEVDGGLANRTIGPHPSHWPAGVVIGQCVRNSVVRGNLLVNSKAVRVQGSGDGFCQGSTARPVTGLLVSENEVRFDYPGDSGDAFAPTFFSIGATGGGPGQHVEDVRYVDNRVDVEAGSVYRSCFYVDNKGVAPIEGSLRIEGNRCEGEQLRENAGWDSSAAFQILGHPNMNREVGLRGNRVAGLTTPQMTNVLITSVAPQRWLASENAYDPSGQFGWLGKRAASLAEWQALSGSDPDSTRE